VKLINTDGLALIGPGSEWFWTAVSGIVLAVTFLAIYRQLAMARSAAAIEQLDRIEQEYTSERFTRHQLEIHLALRDGVDPVDLPAQAADAITNFWERVGFLARRGHVDHRMLWAGGSGRFCQSDWVWLAPGILKARAEEQNPQVAENFEWLVGEMESNFRGAGIPPYDAASLAKRRDRAIAECEATIRVEQSLRTVVLASPDAPAAAVPAAPVSAPVVAGE
jgi:hypothetical protein